MQFLLQDQWNLANMNGDDRVDMIDLIQMVNVILYDSYDGQSTP